MLLLGADLGLDLCDLQLCHRLAPPQLVVSAAAGTPAPLPAAAAAARALSMAAGATCSIGRPRRAAISSGRFRLFSARTVACTTLIGFDEPRDLDRTS